MILIISFISSSKIKKDPFPELTASLPRIFLNLFIAFVVKLLANPDKLPLPKGIAMFVSAFFPKVPNQEPKNPPD